MQNDDDPVRLELKPTGNALLFRFLLRSHPLELHTPIPKQLVQARAAIELVLDHRLLDIVWLQFLAENFATMVDAPGLADP
jgi:hypothetical protein